MKSPLLVLIVMAIPLAACGGPATSRLQGTAGPAGVVIRTVQLTATPISTSTPTPPPPTQTSAPTAAPDIVGTIVATGQPRIYASYPSSDGKWRAEVVIYDCVQVVGVDKNAYEQLKLVPVGPGAEKIVDSQLQYCGGLGAYGLEGLFWSPNSRYFYYTDAREGVPDGCGYWERPIIRLDMADWTAKRLGGGPLSPDKTKIATWQGQELVLWDVNQGETARTAAAVSGATAGSIAWSPDSQALVYLQNSSDCYPLGRSYIVHLDLHTLQHTLLLESETPSFGTVIWDANRIRLFDEHSVEWTYDFVTKDLKPIP